jgi:glycosyltransferase involved in cell wall biosynthesis
MAKPAPKGCGWIRTRLVVFQSPPKRNAFVIIGRHHDRMLDADRPLSMDWPIRRGEDATMLGPGARPLRVLIVTETWPPEVNGVALTVHTLAEGLLALGHQVWVARPRQGPQDRANTTGWRELLLPGARLPRYPQLRFGWPARRRLEELIRNERLDALYVATEGPLGYSAVSAARRLGIPVATGFHTRFDDFVVHYGLGFLRRPACAWLRAFHNRARTTLVPTASLRSELLAGGFRDVRLLARGVDSRLFDPRRRCAELRARWGVGEKELALIHVGRIAPEKNLELVIASHAAIQAAGIPARMVWVGDGPARAALEAAHPEHIWCGTRRGQDLAAHYASADLFLFPSLTETFGNVTLEALASGLPTVAFAYGAAGEHLADGSAGRVVPFADRRAFIEAALALAADPIARDRMRRAARRKAESLSVLAVARNFAERMAELACQGRS